MLAARVNSLSGCGCWFFSCLAGPPSALALALYSVHAWYFGLYLLTIWWVCHRRPALLGDWEA